MFEGTSFLIVTSGELNDIDEIRRLTQIIGENGGKVFIKEEHENNENYLQEGSKKIIHHIITRSIDFIEYLIAKKAMIPITSPEWIYDSEKVKKVVNPRTYNPDPKYFMKECFLCVADDLPIGDKEVIYGGVRAFGGQYLDDLTRYTTHLIATDLSNEKSIIALSASGQVNEGETIDIKIVRPNWIDDCLKVGMKLNEAPYLLTGRETQEAQHPDTLSQSTPTKLLYRSQEIPSNEFNSNFFERKTFYLAPDYNLSDRLRDSIKFLIERHGGFVKDEFDTSSIDVYIGQFREGEAFVQSSKSDRIIIGNLQWLYSILVTNRWVLPINSNFLHYPVPKKPLDSFRNLKISVTNYSGDARIYLSMLITTLGGTFTKTLTRENDYLIAAKPTGKKYEAAKYKWSEKSTKGALTIVNHLWLEECFANWKLVVPNKSQFKYLGVGNGVEPLLAKTKLNENVLKRWYDQGSADEIEDKENESIPGQYSRSTLGSSNEKEMASSTGADLDSCLQEVTSISTPVSSRIGRSAAKKAAEKLHSDITDLNKYKEVSKSTRKMQSYMEELEKSLTPKKRVNQELGEKQFPPSSPQVIANVETEEGKPTKKKKVSPKPSSEKFYIIAIVTGSESHLTVSKSDQSKLSRVGIKVLTEINDKFALNTIIAPRILRTEKFLRSLGQVRKIVHPAYLVDILNKGNWDELSWNDISKEFDIDNYSLDKVTPMKELNADLGLPPNTKTGFSNLISSANKGVLFSTMTFNLSGQINGGPEVISRILKSHGAKDTKTVKGVNSSSAKALLKTDNDQVILLAHKSKDSRMITSFKKTISKGIVLEWEWCVKSIFKMKLEDFDEYTL